MGTLGWNNMVRDNGIFPSNIWNDKK
jgi:hypothetical protein